MTRLDSLSLEELNKLYVRSAFLYQPGILLLIATFLYLSLPIFSLFSGHEDLLSTFVAILPMTLFLFFPMFSTAYVFMFVRTKGARIFFRIWSIAGIVGLVLSIIFGNVFALFVKMIGLWIFIQIAKSANTDALFGPDHLTHAQIKLARKKKRKNEPFTDEELPKSLPNPTWAKICVVCAYLFLVLMIFSPFINQINEMIRPDEPETEVQQSSSAPAEKTAGPAQDK